VLRHAEDYIDHIVRLHGLLGIPVIEGAAAQPTLFLLHLLFSVTVTVSAVLSLVRPAHIIN